MSCGLETPTWRPLKSCFHLWCPWIIPLWLRLYCSPQVQLLNHLSTVKSAGTVGVSRRSPVLCDLSKLSERLSSNYGQEKNRWRKQRGLALLILVTHEGTITLVCLHTLQRSMCSTISFPLNTWQFSSLTCDEDKAQYKGYLSGRWIDRWDALVWNCFLFWGFLWRLSAHHFSFQNTRTNQSSVCFSFLLNSTWKSTHTAGYRVKQKMETVCCRVFTDCCWANLITDLCNSIIFSLDENIKDLNFVKEVENRHNTRVTVSDYSTIMGRSTVLGPIHYINFCIVFETLNDY